MQPRKINELVKNPDNPRTISEIDFEKLKASIIANPDFFKARPLILSNRTGKLMIIGGNQRYEAAKSIGLDEVPTYLIEGLTEPREREIAIRDNVSNGQWDWDKLANNWDVDLLEDWGVELPVFTSPEDELDDRFDQKVGKVVYEPKETNHTPEELYTIHDRLQADIDGLENEGIKKLCQIRYNYFHALHYSRIADYYAYQATPEEQRVFEKLAMVILDKDQLIENGFSDLLTIYDKEWSDEKKTTKKLNTIYIISKGRPHCITGQVLEKMGYTGEWFIVCGNNDETIPEYQKNFGKDRILIFDWYTAKDSTDTLDNFGFEKLGSGAVPVRNATREIARARGEHRHWQLDDDYQAFYIYNNQVKKWHRLTGEEFEAELLKIAETAEKANLVNMGFSIGSDTRPEGIYQFSKRVFNAHNMTTGDKFIRWRGRMNDDLVNAIEAWRFGNPEFNIKYMNMVMKPTQSETGGNTDIYQADGTVRKTAYAVMFEPQFVKLVIDHGRYHHRVNWVGLRPKIVRDKWQKQLS